MTPQVYLHMGAHRTGSSSFQMCLGQNAAALRDAGFDVLYPGRDGADGGNLRLRLPAPRDNVENEGAIVERAQTRLTAQLTGKPKIILSEENLPGLMMGLFKGQFYADAEKRLTQLHGILPGPIKHLLFLVRPYDSFYASAWRLRAQDRRMDPFDTVRHRFLSIDQGWHDLVATIKDTLKPEQMTVLDFRHRPSSPDLVRLLVPELDIPLQEIEARVNTSPSDAAILECQERMKAGETITPKKLARIAGKHAGKKRQFGFSTVEAAHLTGLYDQHLAKIEQMAGVTLVKDTLVSA